MNTYYAGEKLLENPSNNSFMLHSHDDYEIYVFLEGDTKYIVEGYTYNLEPNDVIIIRKHEMHRAFHNSCKRYRNIVLNVSPDFFSKYNCMDYEQSFIVTDRGRGNKINASLAISSGLLSAIQRLKKYSDNFNKIYTPIADAAVIEILYIINSIKSFSSADVFDVQLQSVINYINNSYTENISLDELEKKFFISKYHLCHIFKKATGLTIHKYITHKRMILVRELKKGGKSISDAAMLAGFGDYSSFYRAYIAEYGIQPRSDLSIEL